MDIFEASKIARISKLLITNVTEKGKLKIDVYS